ncbi:leucine-rich repeat domain-containing protein [Trichodesmium erythraeum 21-75]|nr:leucine-rich repeat domain-containing protein [Trichodesmium erythraeum 21-75]
MVKTIETVVRKLWLSPENAVEEVLRFERRFGEENFKLACHCGLFLILTPELVNLIRINFLDEENIPWIGESNFLLSSLCRPLQEGIYEVEPCIREVLLEELEDNFGWRRPFELAEFLWFYLDKQGERKPSGELRMVQEWIAQAYLDPDRTIREMESFLSESLPEDNPALGLAGQEKIPYLVEILAQPLEQTNLWKEYQNLVLNSHVLAKLLVDEKEGLGEEIEELKEEFGDGEEVKLGNEKFFLIHPVIKKFLAEFPSEDENSSVETISEKKLDLSNQGLRSIPESVFEDRDLTSLDLSMNQLRTIPKSISQLSNLTELDLSMNQLRTIPKSISQLSNLTVLDLSMNELITIPESISQLSNLIRLNLEGNPLETINSTEAIIFSILNRDDIIQLELIFQRLFQPFDSISGRRAFLQLAGIDDYFINGRDFNLPPQQFITILVADLKSYRISHRNPYYHPLLFIIDYVINQPREKFYHLDDRDIEYLSMFRKRGDLQIQKYLQGKIPNTRIFSDLSQDDLIKIERLLENILINIDGIAGRKAIFKNAGFAQYFIAGLDFNLNIYEFITILVSKFKDYPVSSQRLDYHPLIALLDYLLKQPERYNLENTDIKFARKIINIGKIKIRALKAERPNETPTIGTLIITALKYAAEVSASFAFY